MLVDVLLPLNFDQSFTYKTDQNLKIGNFVLVSFRNKKLMGVVWKLNSKPLKKKIQIKIIENVIDFPIFKQKKINFIEQMANYNLINKGLILNLFLYKKGFLSLNKGLKKINEFKEYIPKINQKKSLNK